MTNRSCCHIWSNLEFIGIVKKFIFAQLHFSGFQGKKKVEESDSKFEPRAYKSDNGIDGKRYYRLREMTG